MPQMKTWRFRVQLLLILALVGSAFAGTTGKISGTVTDGETGEPLAGVNVIVQGLGIGAATDAEGYYVIINIPPGQYEVRFSMIGYSVQNMTDVRVMIDLTTSLDVGLSTELIEGQSVTVVADRPIVQADVTYSQANISSEELDQLPVEEFEEVISLQAGVVNQGGGMHVRGGRSSEVAYMIDGIPVTDPYNATMSVEVENNAIQELQLISGTFNAEYGQAMSGIINIITREGSFSEYEGYVKYQAGRFATMDPEMYFGLLPDSLHAINNTDKVSLLGLGDSFSPAISHDFQGSLNGPIPGLADRASFYLSGRYTDGKSYLYGIRRYNPDSFNWDGELSMPIENGEYFADFSDVGCDGCSDAYEDGEGGCSADPLNLGPDPNYDNYDAGYNPGGTEGNGFFDCSGETGDGFFGGGDMIRNLGPGGTVLYQPDLNAWFRDNDGDGQFTMGTFDSLGFHPVDWFVTDSIEYVDLNGDGILGNGEVFYDADGNGEWTNRRGDNEVIPMSHWQQLSLQGKLAYKLSDKAKLTLNTIYSYTESRGFSHAWKYNPDGRSKSFTENMNLGLNLQHSLTANTFYTLKASFISNFVHGHLYDIYDVNWHNVFFSSFFDLKDMGIPEPDDYLEDELQNYAINPDIFTASSGYRYYIGGQSSYLSFRQTKTQTYKFDLTSQVNKVHQVKTGIEMKRIGMMYRNFSILYDPLGTITEPTILLPDEYESSTSFNEMERFPWELGTYVQDKLELMDMIVNIGLRFEIFEPAAQVVVDPTDPDPHNPIRPMNRYWDLNGDGGIGSGEDVPSNLKTYADRLEYWFKDAEKKLQFSPRVAVAYPITDRGALHFSYGHFFQMPAYAYLYANPEFELPATSDLGTVMGNANLEPQRTVQYEIGLQQQLSNTVGVDVTGFYKDIRNLLSTKVWDTYDSRQYAQYVNYDFGNATGVTFALKKRMSDGFGLTFDYTYSLAEGNASDPSAAYADAQSGREPEKQLVFLNWDQRHTLNGSLLLNMPYDINLSFVGSYGSGFPYTPSLAGERTAFENSERKPATANVDMRMSKRFDLGSIKLTATLNVYNLFDIRNQNTVWGDTGSAEYTLVGTRYGGGVPEDQIYNTLSEYLYRPDFYSSPRQIRLGVAADF